MATVTRKILCPRVPNFVKTEDDKAIPISELDDQAMRELAGEWLEALRKRAEVQRCADRLSQRVRKTQ
ncbi:MAG: hypothetical protein AAGB04_00345 [Pseudomonadota bacterium]